MYFHLNKWEDYCDSAQPEGPTYCIPSLFQRCLRASKRMSCTQALQEWRKNNIWSLKMPVVFKLLQIICVKQSQSILWMYNCCSDAIWISVVFSCLSSSFYLFWSFSFVCSVQTFSFRSVYTFESVSWVSCNWRAPARHILVKYPSSYLPSSTIRYSWFWRKSLMPDLYE